MLELLQESDDEELILGIILCINNLSQNGIYNPLLLLVGLTLIFLL